MSMDVIEMHRPTSQPPGHYRSRPVDVVFQQSIDDISVASGNPFEEEAGSSNHLAPEIDGGGRRQRKWSWPGRTTAPV